jgi:hypothetical protein
MNVRDILKRADELDSYWRFPDTNDCFEIDKRLKKWEDFLDKKVKIECSVCKGLGKVPDGYCTEPCVDCLFCQGEGFKE